MDAKKEIRQKVLKKRRELPPELWRKYTDIITDNVISHPWFQEADNILCYVDYNQEVGTERIMEEAWKRHKTVYVPKVTKKDIQFYAILSRKELSSGAYGILEPQGDKTQKIYQNEKRSLMVMPGVAFDKERNRIGYGGGYYDRYLSRHSDLFTIAIAFDLQIEARILSEKTDRKPDIIITETRSFRYADEPTKRSDAFT